MCNLCLGKRLDKLLFMPLVKDKERGFVMEISQAEIVIESIINQNCYYLFIAILDEENLSLGPLGLSK